MTPPNPPFPASDADWMAPNEDAFPDDSGSLTGDARTEARVCAVQVLFSAREQGAEVADAAADFLEDVKRRKADKVLFAVLTTEAGEGADRYQTMIEAHLLDKWPVERIDPVHYAILWAAAAEFTCRPETPVKVVINEFVNIAKGFASKPNEVGFIHVVLDRLAEKIRGRA